MTVTAPYEPAVRPPRTPGFRALLHAEWTKLRTVRGFMIALLLAMVLPVGFSVLAHGGCSVSTAGSTKSVACPAAPTGPGGEAVDDAFYFLHQALPADGSITAEVTGLTGKYPSGANGPVQAGQGGTDMVSAVEPWAKVGVMIKASTTPGSAYAAMLATGSNGTRMQWDYTGDTAGLAGQVSASSPRWLRLVRSGSTVTGYASLNGTTWTQVGRYDVQGLPATGTVLVGLFAASPTHAVYTRSGFGSESGYMGPTNATGTFRNVALSGTAPAGPWAGTAVSSTGGPGTPNNPVPGGLSTGAYAQAGRDAYTLTGSGEIAPDVPGGPDGIGASVQFALTTMFLAQLVIIIVAALFLTAEYRRGMIRVTLAASPSRTRVLAAKSVVIFLAAFVASLISASITFPLALHILRAGGSPVDPLSVLTEIRMVAGTALLIGVSAVLALAIAVATRRAVFAIPAVIVVIFIPYLLSTGNGLLGPSVQEWLLRLLPVAAYAVQQAYPVYHQVNAQYNAANGYYPIAAWAGFGVLLLWTAVALVGANWLLRRRDA